MKCNVKRIKHWCCKLEEVSFRKYQSLFPDNKDAKKWKKIRYEKKYFYLSLLKSHYFDIMGIVTP